MFDIIERAIREVVDIPGFDELIINSKRLTKAGHQFCVQQSYGSCDIYDDLEDAVRAMLS